MSEPVTYPTITRDAILDGMVTALATLTADAENPVSADRPLYSVDRYMGELASKDAFERGGLAGRCPAVRMAFMGDKTIRTTIGRRTELIEATFTAWVFSDTVKSKDDRKKLLSLCERVQRLLGSRRLSLEIRPLRFRSTSEFRGIAHCTAYGVQFVTRYRIDYTKDPGSDTLQRAEGSIYEPPTDTAPGGVLGQVAVDLTEESA